MSQRRRHHETDKVTKSSDRQSVAGATASLAEEDNPLAIECPVCLQKCVIPVALPCDHIFCFLCVKGFAARNRLCALCRQEIPADYCERPQILDRASVLASSQRALSSDGSHWYYSGQNGWWQYEDRVANELEDAFKKKEGSVIISISGFQYVVDFNEMVQFQRNDPSRRRKIKRDVVSILKKGIAGVTLAEQSEESDDKTVRRDPTESDDAESEEGLSEESSTNEEDTGSVDAASPREERNETNDAGEVQVDDLSQSFQEMSLRNVNNS